MVTLIIAVLALIVGLAGVVISAIALGRSDKATTLASNRPVPAAIDNPSTASPPAADPATAGATDTPTSPETTTTASDISPTAQFQVAYEGEHLRIRSIGCDVSNLTFVDLDEPRVLGQTGDNNEFGYAGCEPGSLAILLPFAQVAGPAATPADCLETIRTDPGRSPIAPTRGMTLCVVTSQNSAAAQGISQKLVFITVDSITRDNNTGVLNVTSKAWKVPH